MSEVSKFATAVLYPVLPMMSPSLSDSDRIKFPVMNNAKYCVEEAQITFDKIKELNSAEKLVSVYNSEYIAYCAEEVQFRVLNILDGMLDGTVANLGGAWDRTERGFWIEIGLHAVIARRQYIFGASYLLDWLTAYATNDLADNIKKGDTYIGIYTNFDGNVYGDNFLVLNVEEGSTGWVTVSHADDPESKHDIPKWCLYKQGCGNE